MKKIMIGLLVAIAAVFTAQCASTTYKVYDVTFTMKTTKAGKMVVGDCGDEWLSREKGSKKIKGVIAGCGCLAALADPSCENFKMYFWDESTKTQLTNFVFGVEMLQRIGRKSNLVEHFGIFFSEQDFESMMFSMAGTGTYSDSKLGFDYDHVSASGNIVGMMEAPVKLIKGDCNACAPTPDEIITSTAIAVCEDGTCAESELANITAVCGTYTIKFNQSKASKCAKKGVSASALGLPKYVDFNVENDSTVEYKSVQDRLHL